MTTPSSCGTRPASANRTRASGELEAELKALNDDKSED